MISFEIIETAHGFAAIGWQGGRIVSVRLPAPSVAAAEASLLRRHPEATPALPPPTIAAVRDAAIRYFAGERIDFADAPIDLGMQTTFFAQVYAHVRALGWGQTTTYGAVARALGARAEAARTVGQAMAANPLPLIVPCHRVTAADGRIGGFSAPGGSIAKARMLALEGVAPRHPATPAQASFGF